MTSTHDRRTAPPGTGRPPAARRSRLPLALVLTATALAGWAAATAGDWNAPCQPDFPGRAQLVDALPTFACFSVEGDPVGYTVKVSYSGKEHDPEEALALAYDEAGVFWKRFPYPVEEVRIDTTAAFGESAIGQVSFTSDQLRRRFGDRPEGLTLGTALPDGPFDRTQAGLWAVCAAGGATAVLTARRRAAGRELRPALATGR
ncbi:hypothetical protein [Kitasatospora sp. NPDC059571]|uniref:hypothetical protein n=1 Tax=Kitasatospora sp. NPDC059571 TaxID=3346871 RepID=UPI003679AF1B